MPRAGDDEVMEPSDNGRGLIGYLLACYTNPDYCSLLWWEGVLLGVTSWGIWFAIYTLLACGIWYLVVRHRQGKEVSPSA